MGTAGVSVADIIVAVDEPIDATQCGGNGNCRDEGQCLTHDLWITLNAHIFDFLRSVKLSQLVAEQRTKAAEGSVLQDHRAANQAVHASTPAAA